MWKSETLLYALYRSSTPRLQSENRGGTSVSTPPLRHILDSPPPVHITPKNRELIQPEEYTGTCWLAAVINCILSIPEGAMSLQRRYYPENKIQPRYNWSEFGPKLNNVFTKYKEMTCEIEDSSINGADPKEMTDEMEACSINGADPKEMTDEMEACSINGADPNEMTDEMEACSINGADPKLIAFLILQDIGFSNITIECYFHDATWLENSSHPPETNLRTRMEAQNAYDEELNIKLKHHHILEEEYAKKMVDGVFGIITLDPKLPTDDEPHCVFFFKNNGIECYNYGKSIQLPQLLKTWNISEVIVFKLVK
jgi:hypothetical protein